MIDPFSDEADPPRLDGSRAPGLARADLSAAPDQDVLARDAARQVGRRSVVLALALLPAALSATACAHPAPACPPRPADPHHCQHRFCRYYRG